MPTGVETFDLNWSSIETYKTTFSPDDLISSGFERLHFGSLDLMTNIYTNDQSFVNPDTGKQIIVRVEVQTGANRTPSVIRVNYDNGVLHDRVLQTTVIEGLPTNYDIFVPLFPGDTVVSSTGLYNEGPPRSGIVGLYSPKTVAESFQGTWGAADVGL